MSRPLSADPHPAGPAAIAQRRPHRRRRGLRLLGAALVAYGVSGLLLLGLVGWSLGGPIDEIVRLSQSVESQRSAALEALDRTSRTVRDAADGVGNMDGSLSQAQTATDRSSALARGTAANMHELAQAMTLSVFGVQPLISLAAGFNQTGNNMIVLADDLSAIGQALDQNRQDATTVGRSLEELADAVDDLTTEMRDGPTIDVDPGTLEVVRLGLLAMLTWLGALAVGAIGAGLYLLWRPGTAPPAETR